MVKTRSKNYDEMSDIKELMEMLKLQREEDERRREADERKRKEEREEDEKKRQQGEIRVLEMIQKQQEGWAKVFENFQSMTNNEIQVVREEVRQEVSTVKDKVEYVQEEVQAIKESIQIELQKVHEEMLKKSREVTSTEQDSKKIDTYSVPAAHGFVKPPTFDGETPWTMYQRQFEAAAVSNGWNEKQKATALVLALRGKALDILQNIPVAKQEDYAAVVGALELRYGNKYLTQVYQSQLKTRVQGPNESLQEFSADLERMVRLAYPQAPEEFINQISVQYFIDGVRDTDMQYALRLGRFKNLAEAVIHGLENEAAKNASNCKRNKVREVKFAEENNELNECLAEIKTLLQKLNTTNQRRTEIKIECYRCGKKGHISRDCRSRPGDQFRRGKSLSPRREDQGNAAPPV